MDFIREHKVKISVGVLILFIFLMMSANVSRWRAERNAPQTETETEEGYIPETEGIEYGENEIEYLMSRQDALQRKYGDLPEGFIWDMDGNLRSIGDPNKSAEESLYAYLNAISSLDLSTIQRYSRDSYVVKRYDNFFNSGEVDPRCCHTLTWSSSTIVQITINILLIISSTPSRLRYTPCNIIKTRDTAIRVSKRKLFLRTIITHIVTSKI